jgi:hypothetical protein
MATKSTVKRKTTARKTAARRRTAAERTSSTTPRTETARVATAERVTSEQQEGVAKPTDARKCPSCGKPHGASFVTDAELGLLAADGGFVQGRSEDGSPTGLYRAWTHDGRFYLRTVERDDEHIETVTDDRDRPTGEYRVKMEAPR